MHEMNKNIRDLESHIHNLWAVKEQVHTLLWRYMDHPEAMTEDDMANQLIAIEYTLDLYCEKIFDEYKQIAQLDEYATEEAKAYRAKVFKKIYKEKKKKESDTDGRC